MADFDDLILGGLSPAPAPVPVPAPPKAATPAVPKAATPAAPKVPEVPAAPEAVEDSSAADPVQVYVNDWREVSAEMERIEAAAASVDGRRWVRRPSVGAMAPEDIAALLTEAGARGAQRLVSESAWERALRPGGQALAMCHIPGPVTVTPQGLTYELLSAEGEAMAAFAEGWQARVAQAWESVAGLPVSEVQRTKRGVRIVSGGWDASAVVAHARLRASVPRLVAAVTDRAQWQRLVMASGLYQDERTREGTRRHAPTATAFRVSPESGRACVLVRTPAPVTEAVWRRQLPQMRTVLGVDVDVSQVGPGVVAIFEPHKVKALTPFIPKARETLYITGMSTPVEAHAAACAAYPDMQWVQGRTAAGETVAAPLRHAPHALVGGATGAGKSTWTTWLATTLALGGSDLILCDGKGSADYDGLAKALPNVRLFTKTPVGHVAAILWLLDEMEHRYAEQARRSVAGLPTDTARPIALLFDEYGAFKKALSSGSAGNLSADVGVIDGAVTMLLQKARAVRIHLVFVSQSLYAETFPGEQKTNIQVRMSLGVPEPHTLSVVAGGALDAAKDAARAIPRNRPGQGLVITDNEGAGAATRVAVPYGFVPGRTTDDAAVAAVWREVEAAAFAGLPTMTPRIAPVFDAEVEHADRGKKAAPIMSWADYGVHEIRQMPWVRVTPWQGAPPPAGAERYDILNPAYEGDRVNVAGGRYH